MAEKHTLDELMTAARAAFAAGAEVYDGPEGFVINASAGLEDPPEPETSDDVPPLKVSFTQRPTLEEAQKFVGGLVEVVNIAPNAQMIINEEGRLTGLHLNKAASKIAGCVIAGPAWVLVGEARWE